MALRTPNPDVTHPWTAAQDEQLRRLARSSTPLSEIARTLSRSPEAVAVRLNQVAAAPASRRQ